MQNPMDREFIFHGCASILFGFGLRKVGLQAVRTAVIGTVSCLTAPTVGTVVAAGVTFAATAYVVSEVGKTVVNAYVVSAHKDELQKLSALLQNIKESNLILQRDVDSRVITIRELENRKALIQAEIQTLETRTNLISRQTNALNTECAELTNTINQLRDQLLKMSVSKSAVSLSVRA